MSEGRRDAWVREFFGVGYPSDVDDGGVIADLRGKFESTFMTRICECSDCGRLYVQKTPSVNDYLCFEPRSGHYEAVLRKKG